MTRRLRARSWQTVLISTIFFFAGSVVVHGVTSAQIPKRVTPAPPTSRSVANQQPAVPSRSAAESQRTASLAFVRNAAVPSGAVASHSDKTFVNPYLANLSLRALASSCVPQDRATAIGHLNWYASHSTAGVVSDYNIVGGTEVSTGDQDSQDAYSGTFLSGYASTAASATSTEAVSLAALRPAVKAAIERIVTLQDADGLTWAKPTWKVKYLIDQVEVYWGLTEVLPFIKDDAALWATANASAQRIAVGIKTLWRSADSTFAYAKHENGVVIATNPNRAYPDAVSQLWVIASDITTVSQAQNIMQRISGTIAGMLNPLAIWTVDGTKQERTGYWPLISTAYNRTRQPAKASSYDSAMLNARLTSANAWPYDVATAGYLVAPRTVPQLQPTRCP